MLTKVKAIGTMDLCGMLAEYSCDHVHTVAALLDHTEISDLLTKECSRQYRLSKLATSQLGALIEASQSAEAKRVQLNCWAATPAQFLFV